MRYQRLSRGGDTPIGDLLCQLQTLCAVEHGPGSGCIAYLADDDTQLTQTQSRTGPGAESSLGEPTGLRVNLPLVCLADGVPNDGAKRIVGPGFAQEFVDLPTVDGCNDGMQVLLSGQQKSDGIRVVVANPAEEFGAGRFQQTLIADHYIDLVGPEY